MSEIDAIYDAARRTLSEIIENELTSFLPQPPPIPPRVAGAEARMAELLQKGRANAEVADSGIRDQGQLIARLGDKGALVGSRRGGSRVSRSSKVVSALLIRHGGIWGSRDLIASLVTDMACNHFGSEEIGRLDRAVADEYGQERGL